jgi:hypothetical protein
MSASLDPNNVAMIGSMEELFDEINAGGGTLDLDFAAERKMAIGDLEGARLIAERKLALEGGSAEALALPGRIALRAERFHEGIDYLERAVALDPLDRASLEILVICYQRTRQEGKASDAWARLARVGEPVYSA